MGFGGVSSWSLYGMVAGTVGHEVAVALCSAFSVMIWIVPSDMLSNIWGKGKSTHVTRLLVYFSMVLWLEHLLSRCKRSSPTSRAVVNDRLLVVVVVRAPSVVPVTVVILPMHLCTILSPKRA